MSAKPQLAPPDRREEARIALSTFFNIAAKWQMTADEQIVLLGAPARSTYFKWKKEGGLLPHDTLERISLVFGIYKALRILMSDDAAADEWVRKPNSAPMFGGGSALDYMLRGSVIHLHNVRQYLDAERGGWS